jgi:NADPH:quinone reductase-like Zn-dependent oxidoreductase
VIGILSRYGEDGAVWVASRPSAMKLVLENGEEAAAVLAKTRGVAEPAIAELGKPCVGAFASLTTKQSARRLAMLAESGELAATGRASAVLDIIAKYGDPAMDFLWRHKEILASGVVLAAFIADPEPFISGAKDITQALAENAVKPLAEASGKVVGEAAKNINWTKILVLVVLVLGALAALRAWRKWRDSRGS